MALEKLNLLPDQSGYAYSPENELVSIKLDGGLSRSRKDITGAASKVDVKWIFTLEEFQYFQAFFSFVTSRGALSFLLDLLLDRPETEEFTCKFVPNTLVVTNEGLARMVSAQLEVLPKPDLVLDEIIVALYGRSDMLDPLEQLVNVDWVLPNA